MRSLLLSLLALFVLAVPAHADLTDDHVEHPPVPRAAARYAAKLARAIDTENARAFLALLPATVDLGLARDRVWLKGMIKKEGSIAAAFALPRGAWTVTWKWDAVVTYRGDESQTDVTIFELKQVKGKWQVRRAYRDMVSDPSHVDPAGEFSSGLREDNTPVFAAAINDSLAALSESDTAAPVEATGRAMRRPAHVADVELGPGNAGGGLDVAIVHRYIRRETGRIRYCHEKTLTEDKPPRGTMIVMLEIQADGAVASAKASGVREDVDDCVRHVVAKIQFPQPKGGDVSVRYPIVFRVTAFESQR